MNGTIMHRVAQVQTDQLDEDLQLIRRHPGAAISTVSARQLWKSGCLNDWEYAFARNTAHRSREELTERQFQARLEINQHTRSRPMSSRIGEIRRAYTAAGYTITLTRGGHYKFSHPQMAGLVFTSSTPSDSRAAKNLRATLKRKTQNFGRRLADR